jgi:hypothetical protein
MKLESWPAGYWAAGLCLVCFALRSAAMPGFSADLQKRLAVAL